MNNINFFKESFDERKPKNRFIYTPHLPRFGLCGAFSSRKGKYSLFYKTAAQKTISGKTENEKFAFSLLPVLFLCFFYFLSFRRFTPPVDFGAETVPKICARNPLKQRGFLQIQTGSTGDRMFQKNKSKTPKYRILRFRF